MNARVTYKILLGSIGLLVILLGVSVFYGLQRLESSSQVLQDAKIDREVINLREQSLFQARSDIEEYSDLEEAAERVIPQEKDQARTVREIIAIAEASGVSIANISFPTSNLGTGGSAAATESSALTQATPVQGLPGLFELSLSVQISDPIPFSSFIRFLEGLEQNRRTSQVKSVSIVPELTDRSNVTFSINLSVYLKP